MKYVSRRLLIGIIIDLVLLAVILLVAFFVQAEEIESGCEQGSTGDCYEKCIAITFDDGPHGKDTERLLDELKKRDIKARRSKVVKHSGKQPFFLLVRI